MGSQTYIQSDVEDVNPKHKICVASWNINRGIIKKLTQIEHFIHENCIDILALQETDLMHYNDKNPISIAGFTCTSNLVQNPSQKTRMLILIKKGINIRVRNDLMTTDFCSIWIDINAKKKITFGAFYREWDDGKHDKSLTYQRQKLGNFLSQIRNASTTRGGNVVILGDMNIDMNKCHLDSYPLKQMYIDLEECLTQQGIVNMELGNTFSAFRCKEDGSKIVSAIDHLYISKTNLLQYYEVLNNGLSDHSPIKVVLQLKDYSQKQNWITKRSFKNFDQDAFNNDLALQSWEKLGETEDVNVMADLFTEFFLSTLNKHAPYKVVKTVKKSKHIKLSQSCLDLITEQDKLAKQIKNSSRVDKDMLNNFKALRNKVTSITRKEKRDNLGLRLENDSSSKNIWKIVNEQISPNEHSKVIIKENGKEVDNESETAKIFNQHFHDKIKNLRDRIDPTFVKDPLEKIDQKMSAKKRTLFNLKTVSEFKVLNILRKLEPKHSHGFDDISANLLKNSAHIIYLPLTRIINTSLTSGIFPEQWKMAIVKPLFKKGNKNDKANYRPISLLSAPSMVLEKVVRSQIVDYMEKHELFAKNQFGFRSNKSTIGAILAMHTTCLKNSEEGSVNAMALYDLSAAFDCLDADILSKKVTKLGFSKLTVSWIRSYLIGRKQKVKVGNSLSDPIDLPFGSPQGSCLSPCLFIILISDVDLWIENSELMGYCDDTSGVASGKSEAEAVSKLEQDAKGILEFMSSNLLVINPSKTCVMIDSKGSQLTSVKIGNENVAIETEGKLLGMQFSSDLTWGKHIGDLTRVLNQRISIIKRLKEVLPLTQLIMVGEALVNSKIRYGIAAYGSVQLSQEDPKHSDMRRLQILQNGLMRIILGLKVSDRKSVDYLLERTSYLSVNRLCAYHTLQEMFSVLNLNSIPMIKNSFVQTRQTVYETRQGGDYLLLPFTKKKKNEGFIHRGIKLWNMLPSSIKESSSKGSFSSRVKMWIRDNIPV